MIHRRSGERARRGRDQNMEGNLMKKLMMGVVALGFLAPAGALADSPFDGTWKADISSAQMPKKPDEYLLQKGSYTCKTCGPAFTVMADGMDHPVAGHPYYDSVAIKVVDDHTIMETDKKAGKTVATSTVKVAADGKTLSFEFSDSSDSNAAPVTGKGMQTRVGAMPAGAHAISGSWHTTSFSSMSDNGILITFNVQGDTMTMSTPTGQKYTAKMDGTEAPMMGDPGVTTVSVKKLADNKIMETDKRAGKVTGTSTMTIAKDGKSMMVVVDNKLSGTTMSFTSRKQ